MKGGPGLKTEQWIFEYICHRVPWHWTIPRTRVTKWMILINSLYSWYNARLPQNGGLRHVAPLSLAGLWKRQLWGDRLKKKKNFAMLLPCLCVFVLESCEQWRGKELALRVFSNSLNRVEKWEPDHLSVSRKGPALPYQPIGLPVVSLFASYNFSAEILT